MSRRCVRHDVRVQEPRSLALAPTVTLPILPDGAQCEFLSSAQDYPTDELDLTAHLICDRIATYIWRAEGRSMKPVVADGAMLIVGRRSPQHREDRPRGLRR